MDIPICYPGFSTIQPVASLNPHRRRVIEAGLGPTAKAGVSFFQGWAVKVRGGGVSGPKKRCMKSFMYPTFYESHSRWVFFLGGGSYSSVSLELMLGFAALSNTEMWEGNRCESLHLWRVTHLGTVAYPIPKRHFWVAWLFLAFPRTVGDVVVPDGG